MNFEEYLKSEQAREDVRQLLASGGPEGHITLPPLHLTLGRDEAQAWTTVYLRDRGTGDVKVRTYYRPDGDRFIVSDLGDGWRAARLRGADWHAEDSRFMRAYDEIALPLMEHEQGYETNAPWGTLELRRVVKEQLPVAICAVLLASYRVANLEPR